MRSGSLLVPLVEPRKPDSSKTSPSTASSSPSILINFFEGTGKDHRGRTLKDILKFDEDQLEYDHNYIQILFPLPEASNIGWTSPVVTEEVFNEFQARQELRSNLRAAFERILWFYGFALTTDNEGSCVVDRGPNFTRSEKPWNHTSDHNHLRISRIIRSLRVLGLPEESQAFWEALQKYAHKASKSSHMFWRRAAERPLQVRPDQPDPPANTLHLIGPYFLRSYEYKRAKAAKEEVENGVAKTEVESESTTQHHSNNDVQEQPFKKTKTT